MHWASDQDVLMDGLSHIRQSAVVFISNHESHLSSKVLNDDLGSGLYRPGSLL